MKIERLADNPIISPSSSESIGTNINGPSLIRVPTWVSQPLGRYYLYFAHHKGKHIRLAYADRVEGPWTIHEPGVMRLEDSLFPTSIDVSRLSEQLRQRLRLIKTEADDPLACHIASPDVIVVPETREIRMYYHGLLETARQGSRVAVSSNGLDFTPLPDVVPRTYLRVFQWLGYYYALAMPGIFYRSNDGLTGFEEGPNLFNEDMRHAALMVYGETLYVFWTEVGDAPEHILLSTINITGDWHSWRATNPLDVLMPENEWEGANQPAEPSVRGAIDRPVNQLRDPCIFQEGDNCWFLYTVAGESGIAIAELQHSPGSQ